ncbi:helix-turn-helix domain-containing protein [Halorussus salilacus]|uniref:helix-turn-helix domain-containing protein n=1 Tax=Halorussus salilacus TaxID=2953750 RepID=UPI00209D11D3|nr:bacterio-opsin activator domain-containing protein [Halorussus salilacus]USZ67627.1 helix-turn-helix domain-containing protein [Halorussus salilacus]
MSVIAELAVPVDDFPLGRALAATPEMRVELERIVPTGNGVLPFFWVWGDDVDAFVESVRDNPGIDRLTVLDRVDGGALVQAVWTDEPGLIGGILASEATLLEVRRRDGVWLFRLRSPDHEAVAGLQRYCADHGVDLRLNWIHTLSEFEAGEQYGLTDDQRRTLLAAFEAGYFDDPRGTTLEELADEFEVSPRAVSKRLRRGLRNLVDSALVGER